VENIRAHSAFQGKRKLLKILHVKKYIFNTVNSGHTVFQGKRKLLKILLLVKHIFDAVKNFRANSLFQGKCKLLKNPEI